MRGGYIEGDNIAKDEHSYIIVGDRKYIKQLVRFGMWEGSRFNQDSILVVENKNKKYILYTTDVGDYYKGRREWLGDYTTKKVEDFYTLVKSKNFTFKKINKD